MLDGRAWTASELAAHAGVAPSTATGHLHRLVEGGLLVQRRQGRHRYVRLADPSVAQLLEDLSARFEPGPVRTGGLRAATASAALRRGRTCYDPLALRAHPGRPVLADRPDRLGSGAAPARPPAAGTGLPRLDGTTGAPRRVGRREAVRAVPRQRVGGTHRVRPRRTPHRYRDGGPARPVGDHPRLMCRALGPGRSDSGAGRWFPDRARPVRRCAGGYLLTPAVRPDCTWRWKTM
nr:helix-turn-helix domain-containing protein [Verrucosispora sioxanthis]